MVSTAAYGMVTFVVARLQPKLRSPFYIGTPVLIAFIGISRIYLGVHWPTDVLAGFAAGGLVLMAGNLALARFHPRSSAERRDALANPAALTTSEGMISERR